MLIAIHDGKRIRAEDAGRGALGKCPWTGLNVKACVGVIRQYWAYEGGAPEFKNGYEPETEWHYSWKATVKDDCCEVVLGANMEHRADVLGSENTVIEIQQSKIDIRDSRDRIEFYKNTTNKRVIWLPRQDSNLD